VRGPAPSPQAAELVVSLLVAPTPPALRAPPPPPPGGRGSHGDTHHGPVPGIVPPAVSRKDRPGENWPGPGSPRPCPRTERIVAGIAPGGGCRTYPGIQPPWECENRSGQAGAQSEKRGWLFIKSGGTNLSLEFFCGVHGVVPQPGESHPLMVLVTAGRRTGSFAGCESNRGGQESPGPAPGGVRPSSPRVPSRRPRGFCSPSSRPAGRSTRAACSCSPRRRTSSLAGTSPSCSLQGSGRCRRRG